jgi:hypothetical protein
MSRNASPPNTPPTIAPILGFEEEEVVVPVDILFNSEALYIRRRSGGAGPEEAILCPTIKTEPLPPSFYLFVIRPVNDHHSTTMHLPLASHLIITST